MSINSPIFSMFGPSPLRPLQKHMAKVLKCAEGLEPFFKAVFSDDWQQAHDYVNHIIHLENEADHIKRELRIHLPKSLFLPVSRGDVLEMIKLQDRIANSSRDIAGIVYGRKIKFPEQLQPELLQFLSQSQEAISQANRAISELDALLETGFRGSEVKLVEGMIHELDRLEHESDRLETSLRERLFLIEGQFSPVEIIFLYKVIDRIGELANGAHNVGEQLQLLLAR